MNNCPNCGKKVTGEQAVCDCGELLRGEVTHHPHAWETETVFRAVETVNAHRVASVSVVIVIAATILVIAWPQMRELVSTQNGADADPTQSNVITQNPSRSDIIPAEDLLQPEAVTDSEAPDGVFEFSAEGHIQKVAKVQKVQPVFSEQVSPAETSPLSDPANSLEAQLLAETSATQAGKTGGAKSTDDCKPEITVALKKPERAPDEEKPKPSKSSAAYTLGPRGGCFYVTASGGKKYVDRSLCANATAAAGRQ